MTDTNKLRIYVEQHPNKELRTFHVDRLFLNEPWNVYADMKPERIGKLESALRMLPHIDDDTFNLVRKSSIGVTRNPVFSWDEVITAVCAEIIAHFGVDGTNVSITIAEREPWMDRDMRDEHDRL